jgi:hypothetical protein
MACGAPKLILQPVAVEWTCMLCSLADSWKLLDTDHGP